MISRHNTLEAAAGQIEKAHRSLGGCDGSDSLAQVAQRLESGEEIGEFEDTYEFAGRTYRVLSCWDCNDVAHDGLGLILIPRSNY